MMSEHNSRREPTLWAMADGPDAASALAQSLRHAPPLPAPPRVQAQACLLVVQAQGLHAPCGVVLQPPPDDAAWRDQAGAAWQGLPPWPLLVLTPSAEQAAAWAALGATAQLASSGPGWPVALAFAQAGHARLLALKADTTAERARLDERKWVDRAKGLLMATRALPEDDAYKLLRGAAMQANLKLAEVSRAVVDAARWAEAVNRAGQLRMLSQRLVALAAQRQARLQAARARTMAQQALARMRENIAHLAARAHLPGEGASALAAVQHHGQALGDALAAPRLDGAGLALADGEASALLQAADALAEQLQAQGGRRTLAIVNLCGSQRMRVQRLVKDALLAHLLPAGAPERSAQAQATMATYDEVQRRLAEAPLSSPELRALLATAQEGWLALLRAWRSADLAAQVHTGEHLLATLEQLTEQYEHSLQVLMA